MKLLYMLLLSLIIVSSASAGNPWLYCSVPDDKYVWNFVVSLHDVEDFTNGGTSDTTFNYLDITNFIKVGPNPNLPGFTEYKVMDVGFLDDTKNYRITITYAYKRYDMRPVQNRYFYAYSGISEPLFTNQPGIQGIVIKDAN